jgi:ADP-heptose:LPS heptosyltransferase
VVLTGTTAELQIVQQVESLMKTKALTAAGKTSLGSLAVLISRAAAIICNCTGVAHMASALETPAVVISMDGEPWRWAPQDHQLHSCIDWTQRPEYGLVYEAVVRLLTRLGSIEQ